jgi:hypothetical protein
MLLSSAHKSDLNTIIHPFRVQLRSEVAEAVPGNNASISQEIVAMPSTFANDTPSNFLLDHGTMEEARLARLGKRKREPSPEPVLFNPGQGSPDAWQLSESAEDFVRRLPPLTTSVFTCAWIWVHNPHFDARDKNKYASHSVDEFRSRGSDLLGQSIQARQHIQTKGLHGPKAVLIRSLNEESKALQQRITDLAVKCEILSGKVSVDKSFRIVYTTLCRALTKTSGCCFPNWKKSLASGHGWFKV